MIKGAENSKIPVLFELMEERNVKASDITRETGIQAGSISDWKSGRSVPTGDRLLALAKFFRVSTSYLLFGEEEPNSDEEEMVEEPEEEEAEKIEIINRVKLTACERLRMYEKLSRAMQKVSDEDLEALATIADNLCKSETKK